MVFPATFLLRAYGHLRRRRLASRDPVADQKRVFDHLIARGRATRFGRDHDFAMIGSIRAFQERVPLRTWEDFWQDYWQEAYPDLDSITWPGRIPFLAITSGTTAAHTKHIPVSREMLVSNRRAGLDLLSFHLARRPSSRVWDGLNFMLGGSTALARHPGGVQEGDLSGIAATTIPWYARPLSYPPLSMALIPDWPTKLDRLVEDLPGRDLRLISGMPSWLLVLFDRLAEATGKTTLAELFPRLELVVHGGVNFAPYRARFEALLEGSNAELAEVYPASEGFIAFQDESPEMGLRMLCDNGLFYEFIPTESFNDPDAPRLWLDEVETGRDYVLVLSTCAGLWAYPLGDTIRFVSLAPPRIVVTGRTKWSLSAFGEHLIAADVDNAVAAAGLDVSLEPTDFVIGPIMPDRPGDLGHHRLIVEFSKIPTASETEAFAIAFDQALCRENPDYESHRAQGKGLAAPEITVLDCGGFSRWMASRGKAGGQHKVPRLVANPEDFREIASELSVWAICRDS